MLAHPAPRLLVLVGPGRETQSLGGREASQASESSLTCRSGLSLLPSAPLGSMRLLPPQRPVTLRLERGKLGKVGGRPGSRQPGRVMQGHPGCSLSPGPQGKEGGSWGGACGPPAGRGREQGGPRSSSLETSTSPAATTQGRRGQQDCGCS